MSQHTGATHTALAIIPPRPSPKHAQQLEELRRSNREGSLRIKSGRPLTIRTGIQPAGFQGSMEVSPFGDPDSHHPATPGPRLSLYPRPKQILRSCCSFVHLWTLLVVPPRDETKRFEIVHRLSVTDISIPPHTLSQTMYRPRDRGSLVVSKILCAMPG